MVNKTLVLEGERKTLYETDDEMSLILSFNDKTTKGKQVDGKGIINNNISAYLMEKLELVGIENHYIEKINMRQQTVQMVDTIPLQVHVTILSCGRYQKDFGIDAGYVFDRPVVDYRIRSNNLNYPIINESQIRDFGWLEAYEIKDVRKQALRCYDFLAGVFAGIGIRLIEIKLEFGRVFNGEEFIMMLVDEISPDTCRLWDMTTNEKLGFEVEEEGESKILPAYSEVWQRVSGK